MDKIQKKKIFSKINFENILILYIILQPIIDIITSLCVRNLSQNLTLGIFVRTLFMLFIMIYAIIKVDKKSRLQILLYYSFIAIYCISFIINSYTKYGLSMIFTQIKGLVKTFYFPIILASLLLIYKNKLYSTKQKYLNITLAIYVLTILICKIFSVGYLTYPLNNKAGTIGLFFAGNETSAIVAMLSPICFGVFISQKFNFLNAILCALTVFTMLEIGTKVAFVAIVGLLILSLIISIIKLIKKDDKTFYKQFITIILIAILTFLFVGYTSAGKNLSIGVKFLKEENITTTPSEGNNKADDDPINDPTVLLSGRNNYFKKTLTKYGQSSAIDKFLGIGYISPKGDTIIESKLVEIDYFDIFFCHGILGTLIYIVPLAVVILIAIKKFFTKFINNISNNMLIFTLYSIAIGFGIALMAGHVFTAPAVSMFLILSILEILSILGYKKDLRNK